MTRANPHGPAAIAAVLRCRGVRGPDHDHDGDVDVYAKQLAQIMVTVDSYADRVLDLAESIGTRLVAQGEQRYALGPGSTAIALKCMAAWDVARWLRSDDEAARFCDLVANHVTVDAARMQILESRRWAS